MYFRVHLGNDPQGALRPLDKTDYTSTPQKFTPLSNCNAVYDSTNSVYTVTSTIDLNSAAPDNNDNLCGMVNFISLYNTCNNNSRIETPELERHWKI